MSTITKDDQIKKLIESGKLKPSKVTHYDSKKHGVPPA